MQNDIPTYETDAQRLQTPKPDPAEKKLGSAQPRTDAFDAVAGTGAAGIPTEFGAAESRTVDVIPIEGIPVETQPTDFMTAEARPSDRLT